MPEKAQGEVAQNQHEVTTKIENVKKESPGRIGAIGYGLNAVQQEAIADLWAWQERSLNSNTLLGGPLRQ